MELLKYLGQLILMAFIEYGSLVACYSCEVLFLCHQPFTENTFLYEKPLLQGQNRVVLISDPILDKLIHPNPKKHPRVPYKGFPFKLEKMRNAYHRLKY